MVNLTGELVGKLVVITCPHHEGESGVVERVIAGCFGEADVAVVNVRHHGSMAFERHEIEINK